MVDEKTLAIIISIIGIALSVATFFIGRFSQHKTDGEKTGEIQATLKTIDDGVHDIKKELRDIRETTSKLSADVAVHESKLEMIFKNYDLKRGGG